MVNRALDPGGPPAPLWLRGAARLPGPPISVSRPHSTDAPVNDALRTTLAALAALAGVVAIASGARAQDGQADASTLPTCAQAGTPRVAIMTPPGKSPGQIRDAVEHGNLFPAGTQALILEPGQYTRLRNPGPSAIEREGNE